MIEILFIIAFSLLTFITIMFYFKVVIPSILGCEELPEEVMDYYDF